ncbi:MAG: DUF5034 domain-containing protein [Chitinophagaceae bacterium]|nr:DUF5034 domain-containing protein [Chitinophagaceae bacterium]
MILKKVIILLLVPFATEVFISCCDCNEPQLFKYTNQSFDVKHLDNQGQSPVIPSNGTALKEAYGLRMTLTCETTVFKQAPVSFFINRSYAFSCGCDPEIQYLAKDSVIAIHIITLDDFDNQHLAGSDISEYFKLHSQHTFISIAEYLQKIATIFYYDNPKTIILDALLMQPPLQSGNYRFKIKMTLSDGRSFTAEPSTIELI